jgi:hypothetical protein
MNGNFRRLNAGTAYGYVVEQLNRQARAGDASLERGDAALASQTWIAANKCQRRAHDDARWHD